MHKLLQYTLAMGQEQRPGYSFEFWQEGRENMLYKIPNDPKINEIVAILLVQNRSQKLMKILCIKECEECQQIIDITTFLVNDKKIQEFFSHISCWTKML